MTRQTILMILIMTLLMGLILSAVFTWQAQGFHNGFLVTWMSKFMTTYVVVLPTVIVVSPIAQRLSVRLDQMLGPKSAHENRHITTKDNL